MQFCPTDEAFSGLPNGTLANMTNEDLKKLLQGHIIPETQFFAHLLMANNKLFPTMAGTTKKLTLDGKGKSKLYMFY